jgi:uncharacterized protein with ParB-like and HNH nuclease domain
MESKQAIQSGFKYPISISDAIANIESRKFLLPAIQRKFVWSSEQIEVLFDSIMRDYPINSFMMWNVTSEKTKNSYKFYEFLKEYRAFFKDENPFFNTRGYTDFMAIIDGQQRLTSLYLGLKGTYAYKMPRKWWKDNEDCLPTRKLFLNLTSALPKDDDRKMTYNFRFLSQPEVNKLSQSEDLFLVNDIYLYQDQDALEDYMSDRSWKDVTDVKFAKKSLRKLREVVFKDKLINYYQEENQDIDTVLDIFIRTNSGGEPLSFSNLLMSITTANWKKDARKEFKVLIDAVYANNFIISADLILKCCLVLFNDNIKFQVANFDAQSVSVFDENWERIKKCIEVTFELLKKWGFNDSSLRAKNAIIPIVYYIYHNEIEDEICKDIKHTEEKNAIRKWLCISLLKGVFGGQSDSVLTGIRKVLKSNLKKQIFPFEEIKAEFASNDAKSLTLSDEVIDDILKTQKDAPNSYAILALLYSHLRYDTIAYHKDHLHPAAKFCKLKESDFSNKEEYDFYRNVENWNSILNLQLLDGSTNESKNDEELSEWVKDKNINLKSHLIPENVSLEFKDFKNFIDKRKELLTTTIKAIVGEK